MPCSGVDATNSQQTARSLHVGGVYCSFADGGVHWISDFVQTVPSSVTNPSIWDRLLASGDGKTVTGDDF
jgi:hypothetical protein